jgi:hypothetical protein
VLFVGVDWGEAHHDLCLLDEDGTVLTARRIPDGLTGVAELHVVVAAHAEDPGQVAVGIETDRGLLVGALLAAGYRVYAVNPHAVSRYRGRHGTSRAKSDRGDAKLLADLVRTTATTTARSPATHQRWRRSRCWPGPIRASSGRDNGTRMRSAAPCGSSTRARWLRLVLSWPSPRRWPCWGWRQPLSGGRQLTRAAVRRALVGAERRRNLQARVVAIHDALAAPQLAAAEPVEAAYRHVIDGLVALLSCLNEQVAALEEQLAAGFAAHPDAAIVRSQPGLGVVLGARVLAEFGDDPARYQTAKGRKAFAGTAPVTRSSGLRTVVVARAACNQRLADACYLWAFAALTASPGARRCYDAHRARGATHHQALRALGNRLVGILHGCLAGRVAYQEAVAWPAAETAA